MKMYFFSFIESKLGFWNSLHFYLLQGLAGSVFNVFISDDPGVVSSVGAAVHSYSLYLENILYSFRPKGNFNFFQNHYQS
jgi:membrane associated rhomboid family serine protease